MWLRELRGRLAEAFGIRRDELERELCPGLHELRDVVSECRDAGLDFAWADDADPAGWLYERAQSRDRSLVPRIVHFQALIRSADSPQQLTALRRFVPLYTELVCHRALEQYRDRAVSNGAAALEASSALHRIGLGRLVQEHELWRTGSDPFDHRVIPVEGELDVDHAFAPVDLLAIDDGACGAAEPTPSQVFENLREPLARLAEQMSRPRLATSLRELGFEGELDGHARDVLRDLNNAASGRSLGDTFQFLRGRASPEMDFVRAHLPDLWKLLVESSDVAGDVLGPSEAREFTVSLLEALEAQPRVAFEDALQELEVALQSEPALDPQDQALLELLREEPANAHGQEARRLYLERLKQGVDGLNKTVTTGGNLHKVVEGLRGLLDWLPGLGA